MPLDRGAAAAVALLVAWVLVSGLDDLLIDLVWLARSIFRRRHPEPDLSCVPERPMAVFVPCWREHRVIRHMVEHNLPAQHYENFHFFLGAYPNDRLTLGVIEELASRFPNVHAALCPHDGPTSKADCLNWIYQRMLLWEEQNHAKFEMVLTHDAEDIIHPEALRWINHYAQRFDMVQIPVLALPTSPAELTHGVYCDEFAQFQLRDMPVRNMLGGFVPSNGVGAGFSRRSLDRMAAAHNNRIFEPGALTEDYLNGFRVHQLGGKQIFVPLERKGPDFAATREYFPRTFRTAVRQRTRWTMGIALQTWEYLGLRDSLKQAYWLWRDRKTLVNNLIVPALHALTAACLLAAGQAPAALGRFLALVPFPVLPFLAGLEILHQMIRAACSARIYGWRFASLSPLRAVWGNWINSLAAYRAIWCYASARLRGRPLVWLKTEHAYPNRTSLLGCRGKLERVLVQLGHFTEEQMNTILRSKPPARALGVHLLHCRLISENDLYEAISLEHNLPFGRPESVSASVARSLPVELARRWKVLPFKVAAGHLHVAGPEPPNDTMEAELRAFSSLEIRFQLLTPGDFAELAARYLPEAAVSEAA